MKLLSRCLVLVLAVALMAGICFAGMTTTGLAAAGGKTLLILFKYKGMSVRVRNASLQEPQGYSFIFLTAKGTLTPSKSPIATAVINGIDETGKVYVSTGVDENGINDHINDVVGSVNSGTSWQVLRTSKDAAGVNFTIPRPLKKGVTGILVDVRLK